MSHDDNREGKAASTNASDPGNRSANASVDSASADRANDTAASARPATLAAPARDPNRDRHAAYLRGLSRRAHLVLMVQWSILVGWIVLWEIAARLGWIDAFLLSSPSRILSTIIGLAQRGELWLHVGVTLWETVIGFLIGGALGGALAIALWWSETLYDILDPYLVVLNSLPKIALGPIIIVWMGSGMRAIVVIAVLISVIVTLITMLTGFREIDSAKITLMRSLGASRWQILWMVVWPGSLPTTVSALKLNVGMSWVGVIVGEFLVSRAGLGYLIVYGGQVFKLDLVMAATAVLCVAAVVMYKGVAALEAWVRRKRGL